MSRPKDPSKYRKYDTQIRRWLQRGATHRSIADKLNELVGEYDAFTESGVNYYCKRNGLISYRSKVIHSSRFDVVECNSCEYCRFIISANGKGEVRMCKKANRMITNGTKTPTWCKNPKKVYKI